MNYLITHVKHGSDRDVITHVLAHQAGLPSTQRSWEKQQVITAINSGRDSFETKPPNGRKGSPVRVVAGRYLRSDSNSTPRDNLENLPEF